MTRLAGVGVLGGAGRLVTRIRMTRTGVFRGVLTVAWAPRLARRCQRIGSVRFVVEAFELHARDGAADEALQAA